MLKKVYKYDRIVLEKIEAEVAELADAHDSKSCEAIHVGSTPTFGTNKSNKKISWMPLKQTLDL